MCAGCYESFKEDGSIPVYNEKVEKAIQLIDILYSTEGGEAGGYGHIVFDDLNLDCAEGCITDIENNSLSHLNFSQNVIKASRNALEHFVLLTDDEKVSAMAIRDGFMDKTPSWTF